MSDQIDKLGSKPSHAELTAAEREALVDADNARAEQDEAQNDARAEQQMLEGAIDTDASVRRIERERSRDQDEPDDQLDLSDPVPPKGI
ncbi:MAG: hypothetical protein H7234_01675 [Herminiimonas sp.]|nr:hypothetical protein [Herminiimonas sp.]